MQPQLSLPCPTCGGDLTFLDQYQRHFCYGCQQYAPEGYGARGANKCPTCGGILSYVAVYDRYFCYRCQQYPAAEAIAPQAAAAVDAPPAAPASAEATPPPAAAGSPEPTHGEPESTETASPEDTPTAAEETVEEELIVVEQPPLSRELIGTAKKPMLLDLCKAYDLDPTGTKDELRERLLSHLEEQESAATANESEAVPEEIPEETEVAEETEGVLEERPESFAEETVTAPEPEPVEGPAMAERAERAPEPSPEAVSAAILEAGLALPVAAPETLREGGEAAVTRPTPAVPARAEHPCPRCGRELDYIAQYDRWFCHSCRTYAPKRAFKHACPTCGATLRWIERYGRWWCDSEQKYAPSELPTPEAEGGVAPATAAAIQPVVVPQTIVRSAIETHRHRSPGAGIGVAAFGLFLWLTYQLAVAIPAAFAIPPPVTIPSDVAFLLQFLGVLLLSGGMLVGLSALRNRR